MSRPCICCGKCKKSIFVIAIFDESSGMYINEFTNNLNEIYFSDVRKWNENIDQIKKQCDDIVRIGLLSPPSNDGIIPNPTTFPAIYDTDRPLINFSKAGKKTAPRLTKDDIINLFNSLMIPSKEELSNGPEALVFILDNSGSILINQYAEALMQAKQEIKENYSKLNILDDIITYDERWLFHVYEAVKDNICCSVVECCKTGDWLKDVVKNEIKINVSGDGYSEDFKFVINDFKPTPYEKCCFVAQKYSQISNKRLQCKEVWSFEAKEKFEYYSFAHKQIVVQNDPLVSCDFTCGSWVPAAKVTHDVTETGNNIFAVGKELNSVVLWISNSWCSTTKKCYYILKLMLTYKIIHGEFVGSKIRRIVTKENQTCSTNIPNTICEVGSLYNCNQSAIQNWFNTSWGTGGKYYSFNQVAVIPTDEITFPVCFNEQSSSICGKSNYNYETGCFLRPTDNTDDSIIIESSVTCPTIIPRENFKNIHPGRFCCRRAYQPFAGLPGIPGGDFCNDTLKFIEDPLVGSTANPGIAFLSVGSSRYINYCCGCRDQSGTSNNCVCSIMGSIANPVICPPPTLPGCQTIIPRTCPPLAPSLVLCYEWSQSPLFSKVSDFSYFKNDNENFIKVFRDNAECLTRS